MRMRIIIVLLLTPAPLLRGAEVGSFRLEERIAIAGTGGGEITCTITPDAAPLLLPLDIPFDRGIPGGEICTSDSSVSAVYRVRDGIPMLHLTGSRSSAEPLMIGLRVDSLHGWGSKAGAFGNRTVVLSFRSTTPRRISRYTGALILPEGFTVTSVVSSEPAQTEKEPAAPFTIFDAAGRTGISIHRADLGLSDVAQVTFRIKPAHHSPVLLICCSVIGVLYLIFFRNVLKDNGNGSSAA